MPQLQTLNSKTHQSIRVNRQFSNGLGYDAGAVMVVPNEIVSLQREYPILFRKHSETGRLFPNALLGFEQNENLFLAEDGHWKAKNIPLLMQKGPFLITADNQGEQTKAVLAVDLDDPRVSETNGEPLFDAQGKETDYLSELKDVMSDIHHSTPMINAMVDTFMDMQLIEPLTLDITLDNGQHINFQGAYTISEEKLTSLSAEQLKELQQAGLLSTAYYIAHSIDNVTQLIELKNQKTQTYHLVKAKYVNSSSHQKNKKHVVIAGGGTSGWLAAAAFSKVLGKNIKVTIIESDAIGRIGVGEATIPPLRTFHRLLGIDEQEMMRDIQATFKLGIEFSNWGKIGDKYIHSFGVNGKDCWACDFQHFWLAGRQQGLHNDSIGEYCPEHLAAREGKALGGERSGINYAYHLDAGLYAEFLKKHAIKHGATHVEGVIERVLIAPDSGEISGFDMQDGSHITGDFFIDCTGFQGRLISDALNVSYEPYGHYLPCDSAVAIQTEKTDNLRPFTQAIAHPFGWQWRIPLQHRVGNGLVYCSRYVSDDQAMSTLMANLESEAITQARSFKYVTGRRDKAWAKNCVAIGLSAGFLEPVESTSIHLAMSSILRLLKLFPLAETQQSNVDEFNRQTKDEMERVRNFIILHYHATQRDDSGFWRYCKDMPIPDALAHRIQLFKDTGCIPLVEKELFQTDSWTQVLLGQHITPTSYHPIVDAMSSMELEKFLAALKQQVRHKVDAMPSHQQFITQYCAASKMS